MAERVRRTRIRLKGLGATLKDTVGDLNDVASRVQTRKEKQELDRMVRDLEKMRDDIKRFCRTWSRTFDVYE
jgi:hypothetical protein